MSNQPHSHLRRILDMHHLRHSIESGSYTQLSGEHDHSSTETYSRSGPVEDLHLDHRKEVAQREEGLNEFRLGLAWIHRNPMDISEMRPI